MLKTPVEVAQGVATTFRAYVEGIWRENHAVGQGIVTFDPYTDAKATRLLKESAALAVMPIHSERRPNWPFSSTDRM